MTCVLLACSCPCCSSPPPHILGCSGRGSQVELRNVNLCIPESFLPVHLLFPVACDPPVDLQSKCSDNKCQVHWKRPEAYEEILEDWQWELAFKAVQEPWEVGEAKGRR